MVYPINNMTGDAIGQTLIDFIHDFGVPTFLTFKFHVSEPRKPEQNPAEGGIRE